MEVTYVHIGEGHNMHTLYARHGQALQAAFLLTTDLVTCYTLNVCFETQAD